MKNPNVYLVHGGNALWLDAQSPGVLGTLMSCPIVASTGAPSFDDGCECDTLESSAVGELSLALMMAEGVELS